MRGDGRMTESSELRTEPVDLHVLTASYNLVVRGRVHGFTDRFPRRPSGPATVLLSLYFSALIPSPFTDLVGVDGTAIATATGRPPGVTNVAGVAAYGARALCGVPRCAAQVDLVVGAVNTEAGKCSRLRRHRYHRPRASVSSSHRTAPIAPAFCMTAEVGSGIILLWL